MADDRKTESVLVRIRPILGDSAASTYAEKVVVRIRTGLPPDDVKEDEPDAYTSTDFTTSGSTATLVDSYKSYSLNGYEVILVDSVEGVAQITTVLYNVLNLLYLTDTLENYSWTQIRILEPDTPYYTIRVDTEEFDPQCMIPLSTVRDFDRYWREGDTVEELWRRAWTQLTTWGITTTKRYIEFKFIPTLDALYQSDFQQVTLLRKD